MLTPKQVFDKIVFLTSGDNAIFGPIMYGSFCKADPNLVEKDMPYQVALMSAKAEIEQIAEIAMSLNPSWTVNRLLTGIFSEDNLLYLGEGSLLLSPFCADPSDASSCLGIIFNLNSGKPWPVREPIVITYLHDKLTKCDTLMEEFAAYKKECAHNYSWMLEICSNLRSIDDHELSPGHKAFKEAIMAAENPETVEITNFLSEEEIQWADELILLCIAYCADHLEKRIDEISIAINSAEEIKEEIDTKTE